MRILPTLIHGIFDYIIGILVIASPWIYKYDQGGSETWGPILIISVMFFYDLLTDFECGLIKFFAMPAHLWFDLVAGLVLIFSPWLFSYSSLSHTPQLVFGVLIILNSLMSQTLPSYAEKK